MDNGDKLLQDNGYTGTGAYTSISNNSSNSLEQTYTKKQGLTTDIVIILLLLAAVTLLFVLIFKLKK